MDGYSLNSATIKQLGADINTQVTEFVDLMNAAMGVVNDSKGNFDSPAATSYRNKMEVFVASSNRGVQEVLGALSEAFAKTAALYEKTDDEIATATTTYLDDDLFGGGSGGSSASAGGGGGA